MTDMEALIAKLEEASEGSRELDAEIFKVTSGLKTHPRLGDPWIGPDDDWNHGSWGGRSLLYTTSLDAALTLVPDGWGVVLEITSAGCVAEVLNRHDNPLTYRRESASAPAGQAALALCIAALKARSAQDG